MHKVCLHYQDQRMGMERFDPTKMIPVYIMNCLESEVYINLGHMLGNLKFGHEIFHPYQVKGSKYTHEQISPMFQCANS